MFKNFSLLILVNYFLNIFFKCDHNVVFKAHLVPLFFYLLFYILFMKKFLNLLQNRII